MTKSETFNVVSSWSRNPRVHLGIMIKERRAPACWQYDHVQPCCPCVKVGDTFGLPPEPPIGAELKVVDGDGTFQIRHGGDGWYIVGTGAHNSIRWVSAFRTWLSEPGTVATVVKLP